MTPLEKLLRLIKDLWPFARGQNKPAATTLSTGRGGFALVTMLAACLALCVLLVVGSVAGTRIALLTAALLVLAGLIVFDIRLRRSWDRDTRQQLNRMGSEYERLARELARHRQDVTSLRQSLAAMGTAMRQQSRLHGEAENANPEQRMLRTIAQELSRLAVPADEPAATGSQLVEGLDVALMTPQTPLSDGQVARLLKAAVEQDSVDLFVQPIVALPQRKLRFAESFARLRIRDDVHIPAERYVPVALAQDLLPAIDNLLLLRTLQALRKTAEFDANRAFFCNITPLTLNDPKFMSDLVEFISQNRALAPRLIFELGQRDLATMPYDTLPVLAGLSHLGCRFSMDRVQDLGFDFDLLETRFIRFIKIDAALLLSALREPGGLLRLKRLKDSLDREGIDVIVEKVENERQLVELLDLDIDYGQGFLFGHPLRVETPSA